MTLDDLEQLEQKRLKATPGPWAQDEEMVEVVGGNIVAFASGSTDNWNANAAYLAALSPEVVGELIRLAQTTLRLQAPELVHREEPRS